MTFSIIILIIAIIIVLTTAIKPKYGLLFMLCCYILMPDMPIDIGLHLNKNHILMIVLIVFYAMQLIQLRGVKYRPYMFCIVYLVMSFVFIPFKETNSTIQLYYIIYDGAIILLFPIAIWNVLLKEQCIKSYRIVFITCITIAATYGLFLLSTNEINPWTMLFSILQGDGMDTWSRYYADDNRLFGRISSVFFHPMHYAAFLGFAVIYVVYLRNKYSSQFFLFVFIILIINLVTCGVRSVLGASLLSTFTFLIIRRNVKITIRIVLFLSAIMIVAMFVPGLDSYIMSIFSKPENSTVGGSSIEMRLEQLEGAFAEIRNNPLFGRGYGWSRDYLIQNQGHPILLGFESIIFVVLCNNGIIGIFLYAMFGLLYYFYVKQHITSKDRPYFICLLVYYYTYECITGEFAFQFFVLFYTFMLYEYYYNRKFLYTKTCR